MFEEMGQGTASSVKLLRRFARRCARREAEGEGEMGLDWERGPEGHLVLVIREGHLVAFMKENSWNLYIRWDQDHGDRFLHRGSRGEMERLARQIQRVGPPGGPDFRGQANEWRQYDDDTEHGVAVGGGLRLMPPVVGDGDGVLVLAHNDASGSVSVLGVGAHEDLQGDAERLGNQSGERLRLWIGGRPRYLQALGADGIVGYLDLGDDLFVLGHLGGDRFGLACQSGEFQREIRLYSLDEVLLGDLGSVNDWAGPPRARTSGAAASTRQAAPPRVAPRPSAAGPGRTKPRPAAPSSQLAGLELIRALIHLTPVNDWTGEASQLIPRILNGIRGLVQLDNLGNKTLWAAELLPFIAEQTGQKIYCCTKILNAALRHIARRTRLLVRNGRRWDLRLGDLRRPNSELVQWMIRRGPLDRDFKPRRPRRANLRRDVKEPARTKPVENTAPASTPPTSSTIESMSPDSAATPPSTSPELPRETTEVAQPIPPLSADTPSSPNSAPPVHAPFDGMVRCDDAATGSAATLHHPDLTAAPTSPSCTVNPSKTRRPRVTPSSSPFQMMSPEAFEALWTMEVQRWQQNRTDHSIFSGELDAAPLPEPGSGGWRRRDPGMRQRWPP